MLLVGSEDQALYGFDQSFEQTIHISKAHEDPVYTMEFVNDNIVASGDDDGVIKVWDLRDSSVVYEVDEQKGGTVTDIKFDANKHFMLGTNSAGTLGVFDLRKDNKSKEKLYALSDVMEEELSCLQLCKVR